MTGLLKLFAVDIEDLAVLSAHLEGATFMVNHAVYLPQQKRFAFVADRNCQKTGNKQRVGVHFEGVVRVEHKNVALDKPDQSLQLLALTFDPVKSPAGYVILYCVGGERIRLEVDYIEAALSDLADDKAENV